MRGVCIEEIVGCVAIHNARNRMDRWGEMIGGDEKEGSVDG